MKVLLLLVLLVALAVAAAFGYARVTGLDARGEPPAWEARLARTVRGAAIPAADRSRRNPVPHTADAVTAGLEHFADHCASCHANDGSGATEMGKGLWPKVPDMRRDETQRLTDGELFYVIERGVRFTGMPGWSTGPSGEESTWQLVHFIRELPRLTADQLARMQALNPRSPEEIKLELQEEQFLNGQ